MGATICFAVCCVIAPAYAGTVSVVLEETPDTQDFATAVGMNTTELAQDIQGRVEDLFEAVNPTEYLREMADAAALANRGLGVDYASNPKLFVVGAAGSVAVTLGEDGLGELGSNKPVGGASVNATVMAGLNLGFLGAPRLTIFGNYFRQTASYKQFDGKVNNFGLHGQYKVIKPIGNNWLLRWGGIDVTSGISYSNLVLSLSEGLTTDLQVGDAATAVSTVTLDSTGTLEVGMSSWAVPVEVSTNVHFLYAFSFFVGGGMDLQFDGAADMNIDLDGDFTGNSSPGQSDVDLGSASIQVDDEASATTIRPRAFAGLQLNASSLKIFVQGNLMPGPDLGAVIGARFAW